MNTKVQKWGNSQGVRLSKEQLSQANIEVGDAVDVAVRDGVLEGNRRVRACLLTLAKITGNST